jgi:hypothetical protein
MAIRKKREFPDKLPHAHLYLDDVEEISKILLEAYEPVLGERGEQAQIVYSADDSEMDSIDDLKTRGGSTTHFQIIVGSLRTLQRRSEPGMSFFYGDGVELSSTLSPTTRLYSLRDKSWAVQARLKAIFDHRQLTLRNSIDSLPWWFRSILLGLAVSLPLVAIRYGLHRAGTTIHVWAVYLAWVIYLVLLALAVFRPSRVSFVYSYERSTASSAAWRRHSRDFIFLVLGAVIPIVLQLLVKHFSK